MRGPSSFYVGVSSRVREERSGPLSIVASPENGGQQNFTLEKIAVKSPLSVPSGNGAALADALRVFLFLLTNQSLFRR